MNDLLIFLLAVVVIWIAVLLASRKYNLKKKGFSIFPGILMWRTTRGVGFIERKSQSFQRGFRRYGTFAVAVGLFIMFFVFINLIINAAVILAQPELNFPGATFVLPGLIPGLSIAVWLIIIGVVLAVHEMFHGFLLRAQGLKTKAVGAMLFLFIPGAFVEPDEKELMKTKPSKRMRMFAAGPMGNVVFSFAFFGLLLLLLSPKPGVYIYGVADNYPLENFGENLFGERIVSLNDTVIENREDFENFILNAKPGDNVLFSTENTSYSVTLRASADNENLGALGVLTVSAISPVEFLSPWNMLGGAASVVLGGTAFHPYTYTTAVPWFVIDLLKWLFAFNLLVGFFNLLPAKPLDGGYIFEGLLQHKISYENAKKITRIVSIIVLVLLILNFVPSFRRWLG
jgi:membrane-associated protease RseP (regulator of RpoE activity)